MKKARLLITLGDVAGIGPEIVARGWPDLVKLSTPIVVGDPGWIARGLKLVKSAATACEIGHPEEARPTAESIPCLKSSSQNLERVVSGQVCAEAGRAAYDFLCDAIDRTLAQQADAIVTAPLHKEGLRAAGLKYPGHTEILAERTGTENFAMVL